ncbi:MAG: DUF2299 domain-containing protein [Nitrosopumilus sp. B06]|nr:MAG: DUF2299 domain-containing protein [Nitrosopumilus sp. D6]RNJ80356.1 MAG: DUF2299 domain-containing protein [Nitrosopumilus sp. B06]
MGLQEDIERWLTHEDLRFERVKNTENTFQILAKRAGTSGIGIDFFEPKNQPGVLVVGAVVTMKNSQTGRYLRFNDAEKERFHAKVKEYCTSIQAICRIIAEAGKQRIGVYVVLDGKDSILQRDVFDAIDRVSEMHEKTLKFLMRTF